MSGAQVAERHYTEFCPPEALLPFVACYWRFWVDRVGASPPTTYLPPDGSVNVVIAQHGRGCFMLLRGPRTEPQAMDLAVGADVIGVRF